MKCPHCASDEGSVVKETRDFDVGTYRRRKCVACDELFVSLETAPHGLKLPRKRGKDDPFDALGVHLQKIW